ncbi:hypothetical protein Tco_0318348 [Tanacetum coccineum]
MNKDQYAISRENQYAIFKIWNQFNILEDIKRGPYSKKSPIRHCDIVSTAKAVLLANLSNYGYDVISEVPHSKPYHNDMDNQSVHAMQDFEQTPVVDFPDNEITSDSNIISYSQYLQ